jgi:hypothetical protein
LTKPSAVVHLAGTVSVFLSAIDAADEWTLVKRLLPTSARVEFIYSTVQAAGQKRQSISKAKSEQQSLQHARRSLRLRVCERNLRPNLEQNDRERASDETFKQQFQA